jgi:cytochrome c oxidase subunit IV
MADERPTHAHPYQDHAPAGPNFQAYMMIFYVLCVLTAASFGVNWLLGQNHTSATIIVLIAVVKASCVAAIFMHLRFDWNRLYCIIIPVSIMAVMMIIVLLPDIVITWHHLGFWAADPAAMTATPAPHH